MHEEKHVRLLLRLIYFALICVALWLFASILLPWLLPFLLALALAWAMERPVRALVRKMELKRWFASALVTLALVLLLGGGLGLLLWRVVYEVGLLLGRLPTLLAGLPTFSGHVEDWAYRFIVAAPVQYQEFLRDALDGLLQQGMSIPNRFYDVLAGTVAKAVTALPDAGLFLFTTVLATYFSSANRPVLLDFLKRQVPEGWRGKLTESGAILRTALGGWLKAQGTLMLITFGELTIGFLLLRVDLAILLAALVALVDALPVFGTGTVLLPWAAFTLLSGDWKLAVGLVAVYGVVSFVRSILEPKFVGDRVGLPPLAALFAMYLGFQAFGVAGMILSPLAAILLKQLHDSGLIKLWRT